jgi:hypothetical protein
VVVRLAGIGLLAAGVTVAPAPSCTRRSQAATREAPWKSNAHSRRGLPGSPPACAVPELCHRS